MLKKELQVENSGTFSLIPTDNGVRIEKEPFHGKEHMDSLYLTWDEVADMEILADRFGNLRVREFRSIVEALGVMYTNRDIYKVLVE